MRGVSLEEISAATRISTRFLEALENGQWEQLPGGAFNRGFIRSTAHFLGLNEDAMVAEYALETKDQNDSRSAASANDAMPRDWRPLGIAIGLAVLLIVGVAYGYHRYHLRRQAAAAAATASAAQTESTISPAPSANGAVASAPPASAGAATEPPKVATGAPASPPSEPLPGAATSAPPAADTPAVLKLRIEDGKATRLKVLSDGKKVFDGRLRAKTSKSFGARDSFDVTAKELSSLSLELNGQSVPVPSVPSGQSFKVTRKDLKPPSNTTR
jgi:cytoskeleton protein RodZ